MLERFSSFYYDGYANTIAHFTEGNPTAYTFLKEMLQKTKKEQYEVFAKLFDKNIRGIQVEFGFKEYCQMNVDKFVVELYKDDGLMLNYINHMAAKNGFEYKAVEFGGDNNKKIPTFSEEEMEKYKNIEVSIPCSTPER